MKSCSKILSIVYIILFFPLCLYSKFIYDMREIGTDGANMFFVNASAFIALILPVSVMVALVASYTMRKEEKYKESVLFLMIPVIIFIILKITIYCS